MYYNHLLTVITNNKMLRLFAILSPAMWLLTALFLNVQCSARLLSSPVSAPCIEPEPAMKPDAPETHAGNATLFYHEGSDASVSELFYLIR